MNRRDFLKLSAVATAWPWTHPLFSEQNIKGLALDRLAKWAPSSAGVEWRYVAGRITDNNQDSGFIVSISDIKVSGAESQQCLVERQDFMGNKTFTGNRYSGILSYNDITATYTFKLNTNQELVSWQWDNAAGVYKLNVTAPELTLTNLILTPAGDLIPEGGDGEIRVGRLGDIPVISNYHADWTKITINSVEKGIARVDMQGLRRLNPMAMAETVPDYDHNWFVIAAQLNNGDSVWVSAWKIEDIDGPFWGVTIALNSNASWSVFSVTEADAGSLAAPLEIKVLTWQNLPSSTGSSQSAGLKWRLKAGTNQPNDLIDLQLAVPPGQFISGDSPTATGWLLESVGTEATGTVLGHPVSSVHLVVAESSTELPLTFLPIIHK